MRLVGLIGLLAALASVGWLMKQTLTTHRAPAPVLQGLPDPPGSAAPPGHTPGQQVQQQYQQAIERALQAPARALPDDDAR